MIFDEVKNMTTDDSIWGIPCPLDLKRNENIFIIGAKSTAELSRDLGFGAFHRSPFGVNYAARRRHAQSDLSRTMSYGVGEHGLFQNWGSERGDDG